MVHSILGEACDNIWFPYVISKSTARRRLFCFPHAGGAASAYSGWRDALDEGTELRAVQIPGRENRMCEELFYFLDPLCEAVTAAITPLLDKPFAFFGHSMGALLAYRTALLLRREGRSEPEHLFLSAHRAAHLPLRRPPLYNLPDHKLISQLKTFGGTAKELLADPHIMDVYLPIIRADLSVCDTYVHRQENPLAMPFSIFGGTDDPDVNLRELTEWREHTSGIFTLRIFKGGHFYLNNRREEIVSIIQSVWNPCNR
ncbi:thioesterase II family protein [Paenibacillus larvae]|uniref:thioesterase II family protein n=1 Tax=Paenibacillus larvae TaxID=1464 RepID=UPI0018DD25FD|nr:alpha/beta fold hydrolase [Paenibacillus larvae]